MAAIASATFNAFAFAAAGYLFQKIDKGNYQQEMKRHDQAMERLTKERDIWNQNRLKEIDRVQNLRYDKDQSLKDLAMINRDLKLVQTKFEKSEPQLSNYYHPSDEMSNYVNLVKFGTVFPLILTSLFLL